MVVMDAAQGKTADDDFEPNIAYCGDAHLQLSTADIRYLAKEAGAGRIVPTIAGTSGLSPFDMRPKMKKMDRRMALIFDFGRPVRPMLPSAGTSGMVCANWTCEDYLNFAETVAVLVLGEECRRVNEYIKRQREEGFNCLLTYAQMCSMHLPNDMMKLNLHNLVCRVRAHEAARGSTARDSELWMERTMRDVKCVARGSGTTDTERAYGRQYVLEARIKFRLEDKAVLSDVFDECWPRDTQTGIPYTLKKTQRFPIAAPPYIERICYAIFNYRVGYTADNHVYRNMIVSLPLAGTAASPKLHGLGVLAQQHKSAGGIIKHNTNAVKNLAATQAVPGDNVDEGSRPEPPAKQLANLAAGGWARGRGGAGARAGGGALGSRTGSGQNWM
eukprot:jgi/Tetstr1/461143/TSEL_006281.t1